MRTAKLLSATLLLLVYLTATAQDYNPFKSIGKKGKILTLSKGKYVEFFDYDTIQRIGTVLINIRTKKVVKLLNAEQTLKKFSDNSSASRWFSPDPLADKFSQWSPYTFCYNNPLLYADPDGRSGIVTIDKNTCTVTITSTYTLYGSGASLALANEVAASMQNQWNAANGTTTIDGKVYNVKFAITGDYIAQDGKVVADFISNNKDFSQNFYKVEDSKTLTDGAKPGEIGANTGVFRTSDIAGTNTTSESHEFGHGLGAVQGGYGGHPSEVVDKNGNPQLVKGAPSMMVPQGSAVEAKYTKDPKSGNSTINGTTVTNILNPNTRTVQQKDIDYLQLDKLKFDNNGKANLGSLTNQHH